MSDLPSRRTYRLPLLTRDEAILQVPGVLDEAGWGQMIAVLTAMKPGIVASDEDTLIEDNNDEC